MLLLPAILGILEGQGGREGALYKLSASWGLKEEVVYAQKRKDYRLALGSRVGAQEGEAEEGREVRIKAGKGDRKIDFISFL